MVRNTVPVVVTYSTGRVLLSEMEVVVLKYERRRFGDRVRTKKIKNIGKSKKRKRGIFVCSSLWYHTNCKDQPQCSEAAYRTIK